MTDPTNRSAAATPEGSASTWLEDYALVSDTHTAGLISRDGSIDWLCLPRFDSSAMFTKLLGDESHGHWQISVDGGEVTEHGYIRHSMVLRTVWTCDTGTAEVIDFMPIDREASEAGHGHPRQRHDLVRKVRCLSGHVDVSVVMRLRFDYGDATPFFTYARTTVNDGLMPVIRAVSGPDAVHVAGPGLAPDPDRGCHAGQLSLAEGDYATWILTWFPSYADTPDSPDYSSALDDTLEFWDEWATRPQLGGPYEEAVRRSLVVLRALTDSATGGVVAAPTTSLPEDFGGERNWDYRYVWLRDSALAIETLVDVGFVNRAREWRTWLLRAIAGDVNRLRIMYGLGGERHLPEFELEHLPGYENSAPVRIGNGAAEQYQADVVGEVMVALDKIRDAGLEEDEHSWRMQRGLLTFQTTRFHDKDHGIWEMRGAPMHFTHGRAMMWAAFDRGIHAVEEHGLPAEPGELEQWRRLRDELRDEIMTRGWNEDIQSFTQTYEDTAVDASLLQLAQIGFVAYDDPKMLATVARIEQELVDAHGFVHRYRTTGVDGLEGDEYPFLLCSFWLVEQYAMSGRLDDARAEMDRLLAVRSDTGLLAEEYSTTHGRLAGNYPQAFSHLGLVRAAHAIEDGERVR